MKEEFGVARVECGDIIEQDSAAKERDTGYGTEKRHTLIKLIQLSPSL